ncbi:MAG: HD-GYP domain-containing protein [Acidobacteria bacterium]|nr:HD-GYP domain-containing protein [Acidobacteriota bacterium]
MAEKLYVVPLLLAAATLKLAWSLFVSLAVASLWLNHVLRDWPADPMLRLEQGGQAFSLAVIGVTATLLFERWRRASAQIQVAHEETLKGLVGALELREPETAGHSRRVAAYVLLLAGELGIRSASEREALTRAAVLHDIGKIGVPDRILLEEGQLSDGDWTVIRRHPEIGAALVGNLSWLRSTRELILAHHERWDGHGYPRGLAGEEIPFGARIFAVADAFDALTSRRPYHEPIPLEAAMERIALDRGLAFDAAVVDAFLRVPPALWRAARAESERNHLHHGASAAAEAWC